MDKKYGSEGYKCMECLRNRKCIHMTIINRDVNIHNCAVTANNHSSMKMSCQLFSPIQVATIEQRNVNILVKHMSGPIYLDMKDGEGI